jgi:hypothetical protein
MTRDEALDRNIDYLLANADEALVSAESELEAGRRRFSMNRLYYACFYAASAVLLHDGHHFVKHAGVKSALHNHLVNTGMIPTEMGKFYDSLFRDRQEGDYEFFVDFNAALLRQRLDLARQFVDEMKRLLGK